MPYTKSEQKVFDAVKSANDRGHACGDPVSRTKGASRGWSGRSASYGEPNKHETAALERLLASGAILKLTNYGSYVIADHPVLTELAAAKDLMHLAARCEQRRLELESAEQALRDAQAFVRRYGLKID